MHWGRYEAVVVRSLAVMRVCSELCMPLERLGGVFFAQNIFNTGAEEDTAAKKAIRWLGEMQ